MAEILFTDPGYISPIFTLSRTLNEQAERLACCGVDAKAYGQAWAPGLLGTDCFIHLGRAGQNIGGVVHAEMHLVQTRSVPLSETLAVQARTESVSESPRGIFTKTVFDFRPQDGDDAFSLTLKILVPDPAKTPPVPRHDAEDRTPSPEGFKKINARQLEPQHVEAYGDAGNPIHTNPEFAQSQGFRAPIIHGVMTATWLLGALNTPTAPETLNTTFQFRRPVFWDDAMEMWAGTTPDTQGTFLSLNDKGKVAAEMRVGG